MIFNLCITMFCLPSTFEGLIYRFTQVLQDSICK
uniref:Uncharacterized protein n=1 Tax=Rhizophora mucronata TaxID=61149 RepID=A0A2P2KRR3_RHIMU